MEAVHAEAIDHAKSVARTERACSLISVASIVAMLVLLALGVIHMP
jgi:hypothetical protein